MESQTLKQGRGRPSKFKPEYAKELLKFFGEYLDNPFDRQLVSKTVKYYPTGKVKESFEQYKTVSRGVPTLFGFALKIGVNYDTIRRWGKERVGSKPQEGEADRRPFKYPDFHAAYKRAVDFQTEFFLKVGMSGSAPSVFAIFAAKNMIGWRDVADQRFTDENGKTITPPGYVLLPQRKADTESEATVPEGSGDSG